MRQTNSQQGYQIIVKYDKNVCTFFDQKKMFPSMTSDGWISDQKMVNDAGVAEAGGQGGRTPTQILAE